MKKLHPSDARAKPKKANKEENFREDPEEKELETSEV